MSAPRPGASCADCPSLGDEPRYFTRLPDDLDADAELSARPGPTGILRALLRLIRRSRSADGSIVCTVADVAHEAGVSTRTASTHLARLDRLGYLARESVSPAGGQTGRKTRFTILYQLRPALPLKAEPAVLAETQGASNQKKSSASNQKKPSGSSLLSEQRYKTEELTTTTATVVAESSSFSGGSEQRPEPALAPGPPELADLIAMIQCHWPHEPALRPRVARLASQGMAEAALAVEYAALMKADGLVYAAKTRDRWHRDGYNLADCQAEVQARRPKPKPVEPSVTPRKPEWEATDPEAARLLAELIRAKGERREALKAELARRAGAEVESPGEHAPGTQACDMAEAFRREEPPAVHGDSNLLASPARLIR